MGTTTEEMPECPITRKLTAPFQEIENSRFVTRILTAKPIAHKVTRTKFIKLVILLSLF